jgi:ABC-type multidrug transport system ATPase subunit
MTSDCANLVDPQPVSTDGDYLQVYGLGLTLPNGRQLVCDVSFSASPGSLTAIIGPSGAGKSTLAKLVGGAITSTAGEVFGALLHRGSQGIAQTLGIGVSDVQMRCDA